MNQVKLKVVKQGKVRINIKILEISELKWIRMGEFNLDDHYIYYYWQESLRRNDIALIVNKTVWNAILGCNLKNDRMILVHFQREPFNITVIQGYAPFIWVFVIANAIFEQHKRHHRDVSPDGPHQMVNTEIKLTISFASECGKAL